MNVNTDESQDLTNKVLNIKFALEKLNQQKLDLEKENQAANDHNVAVRKENDQFVEANKVFEQRLAVLNQEIKEKEEELAKANVVYKKEITARFAEIEERTKEVEAREKAVQDKEKWVEKQSSIIHEDKKANEMIVLQAENQEKINAVTAVELRQKADNQATFQMVLEQKEQDLSQKIGFNELFKDSLLEREQGLISKVNTIARWEDQLIQLKNAIDNDRINSENEKNQNSYILRALDEIQKWCITNVGKQITEDVVNKIRQTVTNVFDKVDPIEPIVDKSIVADLEAPIVPEVEKTDETAPTPPNEPLQEVPTNPILSPGVDQTTAPVEVEKTPEATVPSEETPKTAEAPISVPVEKTVEKNTPEVTPKKKKKNSFT